MSAPHVPHLGASGPDRMCNPIFGAPAGGMFVYFDLNGLHVSGPHVPAVMDFMLAVASMHQQRPDGRDVQEALSFLVAVEQLARAVQATGAPLFVSRYGHAEWK